MEGNFILLYIFLLLLFNKSNQSISLAMQYPNILTLLDDSIILIGNDGIHFYDSIMSSEDTSKTISLQIELDDINKISMAQFSENDGEYIILLVLNTLYIFDSNKIFLFSSDISTSIDGDHYCLTPYKKDSQNYLHFIISYVQDYKIILSIVKVNLNDLNSGLNIETKSYDILPKRDISFYLEGGSCLFLSNTLNMITKDLLCCFCGIHWPANLYSTSIDPENDYSEIEGLQYYKSIKNDNTSLPYYLSAKTSEDKARAIIYFTTEEKLMFWATFDYINQFSVTEEDPSITYGYLNHKLFYFQKQQEFVLASRIKDCNIFYMIFNKNLQLNFKGTQINKECTYSSCFTFFHNGTDYIVIMDKGYKRLFSKSINYTFEITSIEEVNIENNPTPILSSFLKTIPVTNTGDTPMTFITTSFARTTNIILTTFLKTNPTTIQRTISTELSTIIPKSNHTTNTTMIPTMIPFICNYSNYTGDKTIGVYDIIQSYIIKIKNIFLIILYFIPLIFIKII